MAIGLGWVDGAWVDAGWVTGAWANAADVTAPTLSSPQAFNIAATDVSVRVTTDEGNGTCYMVIVPDGDAPSDAQIKAGQQSSGAAALASESVVVSSAGVVNFARVSGLTASTPYEVYFLHTDAATNDSSQSTAGFTTEAVPVVSDIGAVGAIVLTRMILDAEDMDYRNYPE